jgi:hypothetical protein
MRDVLFDFGVTSESLAQHAWAPGGRRADSILDMLFIVHHKLLAPSFGVGVEEASHFIRVIYAPAALLRLA